jgi:hypothetical protein
MPLYFFPFSDGTRTFPDRLGHRLPDNNAASQYACQVIKELADDRERYRDFFLIVQDEQGEELLRVYVTQQH